MPLCLSVNVDVFLLRLLCEGVSSFRVKKFLVSLSTGDRPLSVSRQAPLVVISVVSQLTTPCLTPQLQFLLLAAVGVGLGSGSV